MQSFAHLGFDDAEICPNMAEDARNLPRCDVVWIDTRLVRAIKKKLDDQPYCPVEATCRYHRMLGNKFMEQTRISSRDFHNILIDLAVWEV